MRSPAFQAYGLLRTGFVVAPILFGIDKFFDWMVYWPKYLAPWVNDLFPGTAHQFMLAVGVIEIVAGLLVLISPRWGSLVVAVWLAGIIINLVSYNAPEYFDVALRDFGLLLGALTLNRLSLAVGLTRALPEVERPRQAA
jgi:uncharacterized membrane protein YphA (DoxX/SURF4 family)